MKFQYAAVFCLAAILAWSGVLSGCGSEQGPGVDVLSDVPDVTADSGFDTVGDQGAGLDAASGDAPDGDVENDDAGLCDPGQDCIGGPDEVLIGRLANRLFLDLKAETIVLSRDGDEKLTLAFGALQIGVVPALDSTLTYDPYPMLARDPNYFAPAGLVWHSLSGFFLRSQKDDSWYFDVWFGDGGYQGIMTIQEQDDDSFRINLVPTDGTGAVAYFRIAPDVSETENFYGLGAYLDQVAHRGKVRAMQLETDFELESSYNEAHVPVPLLISTKAWGVFVESWYPGAFDCAAWDPAKVDIVFGTGDGSDEGLIFHIYAADHPLDITKGYYNDTGDALLPARWGLGPVVWKDEVSGQTEVEWDLNTIRDMKLATTAYWIDRPYASGVNSFDFHPDNYADPQAMIDLAHDLGFRMMLWSTPYISSGKQGNNESSDVTEALYSHAVDEEYLVEGVLKLNKWGEPIDFTNPAAYEWFQGLIRQYTDMGIEGFKLDYGEDIVIGMLGMDVLDTQFFDGSTERTMHSKYQIYYHRIYAETLPPDGGFLMARRGVWSDQTNVSVIWPGDLDASFVKHREVVEEDEGSYTAVGGLPASVIYGLSLGVSGFPFFGSDTGGYRHSPPDKELFTRWAQQTALSSIMQVGNSSNTVPWDLTSGPDLDEEFQQIYARFAKLHLRLWPYEWTYAKNIVVTGRPIQRPFGIAYPGLNQHPDDQYMFGDHLLVAPVVERGVVERDVIFPDGKWYDLNEDRVIEGPRTVKVQAPLDVLPLYLAESGIVPMLRPSIEAMAPVVEGSGIDTYDGNPGVLYPMVHAGPPSEFTLFDGAVIRQGWTDQTHYSIEITDGDEFTGGAVFEILGIGDYDFQVKSGDTTLDPVASVEALDSVESGFVAASGRLYVRLPGGGSQAVVTLVPAK